MLLARARSCCGNQLFSTRLLAGKQGASQTPSATRSPTNAPTVLTRPCSIVIDGPADEREEVDQSRAEPIEQRAAGNLRERVTPAERRPDACRRRSARHAEILREQRARDAEHRPVQVVDERGDEHQRQDRKPAHASRHGQRLFPSWTAHGSIWRAPFRARAPCDTVTALTAVRLSTSTLTDIDALVPKDDSRVLRSRHLRLRRHARRQRARVPRRARAIRRRPRFDDEP